MYSNKAGKGGSHTNTMKSKAVALRYDNTLPAPFLVSKGEGYQAERLLAIARQYDIPITPNHATAEALFSLDPGEMIPEHLYEIVAHLLIFVAGIRERGYTQRGYNQ